MEANLEITSLITPLINTFKLISSEWKYIFDIGVRDYLHTQSEKYYLINTFLHPREKVKFEDIYFPLYSIYGNYRTNFNEINDVLETYKKISLIGDAGSGKSTALKHIYFRLLEERKKIPIMIELRHLNGHNTSFEDFIFETIIKSNLKDSIDHFKRSLKSGMYVFLLDGYDEIFSSRKVEVNRQIGLFIDGYSENNFIITTRPGGGIERFERFYDFEILHIDPLGIVGFINKLVKDNERRIRILSVINDSKNFNYVEYLQNPLLLSMFIYTFESHPEIPEKKSAFYRNVFDTLYSRHDGISKNSFLRERLTNLQRDDFEKILSYFSFIATIEGRYLFTEEYMTDILLRVKRSSGYNFIILHLIYDLRTAVSILTLEGLEYRFPHRSMQEYFTVLFIKELPTNKKAAAYEKLNSVLRKYSNDSSFNTWKLCLEMDKTSYLTYIVVPNLIKNKEHFESLHNIEFLRYFFKLSNVSIKTSRDFNTDMIQISLRKSQSVFNQLIEFWQVYNTDFIYSFWNNELSKQISSYLSNNLSLYTTINIDTSDEVLNLLLDNGFGKLKSFILDSFNKKIEYYNDEIRREGDGIDDILNMSIL